MDSLSNASTFTRFLCFCNMPCEDTKSSMPKFNHNFMLTGNEIIVRFFVMNASHNYILLLIPAFDEESTVDSFVWTGLWDLWYSLFQTLTSPSGHRQRKDSPSIEAASQSRYDVSIVCRSHRYRQQLLLLSTNHYVWRPFFMLNIFTFQKGINIF